jgi:hypothetical protein
MNQSSEIESSSLWTMPSIDGSPASRGPGIIAERLFEVSRTRSGSGSSR